MRDVASTPETGFLVEAELPDHRVQTLPAPSFSLKPKGLLTSSDLELLSSYVTTHREVLGAQGKMKFHLVVLNQNEVGDKVYVRFQQVIQRAVNGNDYVIPVEGATTIAVVRDGKLRKLISELRSPAPLPSFANPGYELLFTETEFATFMGAIKTQNSPQEQMRVYLDGIARRSKQDWNFENFLNRTLSEQRALLNQFFGSLGRISTLRLLVDLGRAKKLALVKHGTVWMLQVTGLFELPFQFDIEIPPNDETKLKIRNLRHLSHKVSSVRAFTSPHYPGGMKQEGGEQAERAAQRFQKIASYYQEKFGWSGYSGKNAVDVIDVHTGLKSLDFRENAAWLGSRRAFLIGEGGDAIGSLESSYSVLGHEYAHALVQYSSGLVYRGEAGALNEHFADIQGASLNAEYEGRGKFDFTVGSDVLRPQTRAEKEKFLGLIVSRYNYSVEEVSRFALDRVGLRHLYAPALSYAAQQDHVSSLRRIYGENCQPSVDNDNCGVHTASGVPNKAASLIIAELGVEPTRSLFFNTIAYRLNQDASFTDYVVQLYDECRETPSIESRCAVILSAFSAVGVEHPRAAALGFSAPLVSAPQLKPTGPQTPLVQRPSPSGERALTPELKFCGWVVRREADSFLIQDEKYNASLLTRNNQIKTQGEFSRLRSMKCACVTGRVTQTQNSRGETFNAFHDVSEVKDRSKACATDPKLKSKGPKNLQLPRPDAIEPKVSRSLCGWVSVDSASKQMTLIDNRFDPKILIQELRSPERVLAENIPTSQCACLTGRLAEKKSKTVVNFFKTLESFETKSPEDCAGIAWR